MGGIYRGSVDLLAGRVGVAFENSDGSFNLPFDFVPTDMQHTTLQLRDIGQERRERRARGDGHATIVFRNSTNADLEGPAASTWDEVALATDTQVTWKRED